MPPLRRPPKSLRAAIVAALLLAPVVAAGTAQAAPVAAIDHTPPIPDVHGLAAEIAQARTERDAAEDALDAAKRVLAPGHLLDPLPASAMAGLGELQAQYAEMERKAAGYRATLGDQHPTLKGAEEVLAELRGQILDGARRAIATAQFDAARTRATVASLERQARAAEATGRIPKPAPSPAPAPALPMTAEPPGIAPAEPSSADQPASKAPRADDSAGQTTSVGTTTLALARSIAGGLPLAVLRHAGAAAAAGLLAGMAALVLLIVSFLPRGRRPPTPVPLRIEPSPPAETVRTQPARRDAAPPPMAVPVLAILPMTADDDPATVRTRLDRDLDAALLSGAGSVFSTLAAAAGPDPRGRIGVVVTPVAGAPDAQADAAAMALASAAARAGRRVLLVDGHADDRLQRALASGAATVAFAEVGGRVRKVVRVRLGEHALAVLAGDAEDEPIEGSPPRLADLDGFDMIVIAGEPGSAEAVAAGFALLVAPQGVAKAVLAAAGKTMAGATGRACGVLLIEARAADTVDAPRQPEALPERRRVRPETGTARLLGLRRTFDPVRRRA